MRFLLVCFLFLGILPLIPASNILMFLTMAPKSMNNIFLPLAQELVKRGHTVTLVTSIPTKEPSPGIREVVLDDVKRLFDKVTASFIPGQKAPSIYSPLTIFKLRKLGQIGCESILSDPGVQEILSGNQKYDLAIHNLLFEDCTLGISKKLDLPFLYVSTHGLRIAHTNNLRIPSCMPYCPEFISNSYTDRMTLLERAMNSLNTVVTTLFKEYVYSPGIDAILAKHLGPGLPPVLDIERNVSLLIINDHFSLTYPRPILPNVVQVVCMHCKPAKALPKEISSWVEGSGDDGFIYFSLGSVLPAHKIPEAILDALIRVFSKLKQRIVWKIDLETIPNLSANVKLFKWLPQQDLLGHPKARLFLTHGGMLSVQEAAYHGVPMIGFPTSNDQPFLLRAVERAGTGALMDWKDITEETLGDAINRIITEPKYKENAKLKQSLVRDLPTPPMETAVYWIEYVLRHKGATHLRTAALELTWYQYHQLDVLALLIVLLITTILLVKLLFRMVKKCLLTRKPESRPKKE